MRALRLIKNLIKTPLLLLIQIPFVGDYKQAQVIPANFYRITGTIRYKWNLVSPVAWLFILIEVIYDKFFLKIKITKKYFLVILSPKERPFEMSFSKRKKSFTKLAIWTKRFIC